MTRPIPITERGPNWQQREYVECMRRGIGFAAHRDASGLGQRWHYKFPPPVDCCVTVVMGELGPQRYIDHDFRPGIDWLERCRTAKEFSK